MVHYSAYKSTNHIWARRALYMFIMIMLISPYSILAQEIPAILTYERSDYGGGNKNWGFAEDDSGNLYVANTHGILIYNGLAWQLVRLPKNRVPRSIYRGFDNRIYVGGFETMGYIDRTDPANPVFVEIGQEILQGTEEEIWHITGTDDQILFQSFSIMIFKDEDGLELYQPHDNIMFGHWVGNRLVVPQIRKGLYFFENGKELTITPDGIPDNAVITGFEQYRTGLVVSTRYHGLFILRDDKATPIMAAINEPLKSDQINDLIRLESGDYAIGTIQNGVYVTDSTFHIKYHINKTNGLANNSVLSLFESSKGALCIGLNIGINILKVNEPDLYYYDVAGKLGTVFTSVYFNDDFFVGTNQGVFKQNKDGGYSIVPGSRGQVWNLKVVNDDLLCGHNAGTMQLVGGQFQIVSDITGGLHMQQISENQLLQSTYTGLVLLKRNNGLWNESLRISGTDKLVDRFVYNNGKVVGLHPYFGLVYYNLDLPQHRMIYRKIFKDQAVNLSNNALGLLLYDNEILVKVDSAFFQMGPYGNLEVVSASRRLIIQARLKENLQYEILKPINNNAEENRRISYFPARNVVIRSIEEGYVKHYLPPSDKKSITELMSVDYILVNDKLRKDLYHNLNLKPYDQSFIIQLRKKEEVFQDLSDAQYRLKPYDQSWINLPPDGRLEFKQLRHGSYTLELQNGGGVVYSLLEIDIPPHWYESWPGVLLVLVICAGLIWLVNKRNKKHLWDEKEKMRREKEAALEAERIRAKAEKLEHEVAYKSKMLANSAMTMVQKNNMLTELKEVIREESSKTDSVQNVKGKVIKLINRNLNSDKSWEIFDRNFAEVHEDFIDRFTEKFPEITPGDLRLAAYIRMNMSSKEIAPILQISVRSVENKRYRLRKKMNLSSETNLSEYLMRF